MRRTVVVVLLSILLLVFAAVGSIKLTGRVLAQPPQPVGEAADFLDQGLTLDDTSDAGDPQWHQHPRYFTGSSEDGDLGGALEAISPQFHHHPRFFTGSADGRNFQAALDDAVQKALTAYQDQDDGSDSMSIKYRMVGARGSIGTDGTETIYVTIMAGVVR